MRIASSPVYLDTSALAKLYVAEGESRLLEEAVIGLTFDRRLTFAARAQGLFDLPVA